MSKRKPLDLEEVLQKLHTAPDSQKKMWERVLKKLKEDPPKKLEFKPKAKKL